MYRRKKGLTMDVSMKRFCGEVAEDSKNRRRSRSYGQELVGAKQESFHHLVLESKGWRKYEVEWKGLKKNWFGQR